MIIFTMAKHSIDNTNSPAIFMSKVLLPLCKIKSIIFCTCDGALYHRILYLENDMINNDKLLINEEDVCVYMVIYLQLNNI